MVTCLVTVIKQVTFNFSERCEMKLFEIKTHDVFDYIENQLKLRHCEWKIKAEKMKMSILQAITESAIPFCACTLQDVQAIVMRLDDGEKPKTVAKRDVEKIKKGLSRYMPKS